MRTRRSPSSRQTGSCASGELQGHYYDGRMTDQPLEPDEPEPVVSTAPTAHEVTEGLEPPSTPQEVAPPSPASTAEPSERTRGAIVLGFVFVVLGVFFLLDELWPDFLSWKYVWPVALIAVGLAIFLRGRR